MVLSTFLLVMIFSAYCYLPYILARAVIGQIERVRMPDSNKLVEFLFASIPGAAFNAVAGMIVSIARPNAIGELDRATLAALFDPSKAGTAVSNWVATADITAPLIYLSLVCGVAVAWAILVALWFVWTRHARPPDGRIGSVVHVLVGIVGLILTTPLMAMLHFRYQQRPWTTSGEIWIRTVDDQIIVGCSRTFDFSGDSLVGVTVRSATPIQSVEDVERARKSADTPEALEAFTLYIPATQVVRLLVRARGENEYYSDDEILRLLSGAPEDRNGGLHGA